MSQPIDERRVLLRRLATYIDGLDDPAVELVSEEVAPLLATFFRLVDLGHRFPRGWVVIMRQLARQLLQGETDGDSDHEDDDGPDSLLATMRAARLR